MLGEAHVITADVTVCTPSLAHRANFLAECMESVRNQTVQPKAHLVGIDIARVGGSAMLNKLIRQADTTWVAPLADDDILYPDYLETLLGAADDADMVYGWCDVTGTREGWNLKVPLDLDRLSYDNYIPATVLIKKTVFDELGYYAENLVCEDHDMWRRLVMSGKKIKLVEKVIWQYRFHGRNVSDGQILPWDV